MTNPGTSCEPGYAERPASDVICLFENERGFDKFRAPAWSRRFPGSRFCIQAHNVATEEQMKKAVRRATELKVGYIYITDDVGPNPYDRLPSYWGAFVEAVRQVNQPSSRAGRSPPLIYELPQDRHDWIKFDAEPTTPATPDGK